MLFSCAMTQFLFSISAAYQWRQLFQKSLVPSKSVSVIGNFSNVGYSRRSIECGIAKDIPLKNYRVEHQTSLNASEVNAFEAGSRNQNVGRVCQGGELLREALPILFYNYVPFRFYF
ncbi:unnamed protein product [Lathyrus sativus]|nr:unnamed protein product [Lathyrus sativus]